MTPLAHRILRRGIDEMPKRSPLTMMLAQATCFDLAQVRGTVVEAVRVLIAGRFNNGWLSHSPGRRFLHGGLLFPPDALVWLEFASPTDGDAGALLHSNDEQIGYAFFPPGSDGALLGAIRLHKEEESFSIEFGAIPAGEEADEEIYDMNDNAGLTIAASLMLINAPRGVVCERKGSPHKGLARQARRVGLGELKPARVVYLDKTCGPVGLGCGIAASRKAFHFCRGHIRRTHSGQSTPIRPHWRGDPSLGICQSSYSFRGTAPEAVAA